MVKELLMEGSEMKTGRFLVLLALVIGLMGSLCQAPAEATMLGRVGQIKHVYYNNGNWYQTLPNGTINQPFALTAGQSFVLTEVRARFLLPTAATSANPGPYRFYLMGPAPNYARMFIANLTDVISPADEKVWGGAVSEMNMEPGIVFSVLPFPQVRQLPDPPADPNSGAIQTGTFYITIRGYVVP
jgi:hypothetical protein